MHKLVILASPSNHLPEHVPGNTSRLNSTAKLPAPRVASSLFSSRGIAGDVHNVPSQSDTNGSVNAVRSGGGDFEGLSLGVNIPGLDRELIFDFKNIQGMDDNWTSKVKSRHGELGRTT